MAPVLMTVTSNVNLKDVAERERGEKQLLLLNTELLSQAVVAVGAEKKLQMKMMALC